MGSSKRSLSQTFYQLIPSRFPPVEVYERLGDLDVQNAAKVLENRTNPRLIEQARLAASGMSSLGETGLQNWNHAPFAYKDPRGTFFLGPAFGCLELATTENLALAYSLIRREAFLANTNEAAIGLDMRVLSRKIDGTFDDLTNFNLDFPQADRRKIGNALLAEDSKGVIFCRPGFGTEEFIAVFDQAILSKGLQGAHYRFTWDGEQIKSIYKFSDGTLTTRADLFRTFLNRSAA